ncbi:subunit S of type I restriction-modification system [mine drainage metagenome]|uniref:Subunit S of type I restriction-modification system n=1 Tax=mine drainage metagenome TaxID=410659 RepID=T0ZIA7_9ZZZZ
MSGIIGGVSIAKFVELPVPLPHLGEQHRIVAKIDQLMARCDELEKLRDEREQKRRSVHTAALKQLLDAQVGDNFADAWQFITQHFGELYAVKENVTELRKAILQLAVMGKLSKQANGDGSVKELLLKVAAERHRLKIRETLSSIGKADPLGFGIPESWEWRCLNDLIVLGPTNGFSPKAVDYETQVRSLTLTATTSGIFKGENSKFIVDDIPLESDLWLRDGDILVQRGNTLEYVGVPAIYRGEPNCYIYPDLMMKLRISSELDTDYVYFTMSSAPSRNFLRMRASGTSGTMPKINQQALKNLPVPIPPLAEQKRIVSKIKILMAMCDTLEQKIDAASCKQTALLDAMMALV